jgi:cobalt-zinc-cadmium efflux system outer membrane protein
VLGVGLSLPIPLPGLGRTYAGEIAEAEASARRSASEQRLLERSLWLDLDSARSEYRSRAAELAAFIPEQLERARTTLQALAHEVQSGRLAVRDAIVAQAALIELLEAHVAARAGLCLASVELVRAAGVPLSRWLP